MRVAFLLVALCALQGCTALGAGLAADLNRQHRADVQVDLAADSLLAPGDSLVLHLAGGREVRSALVSVRPDSVHLNVGTYALAEVQRAERPWQRASVGRGAGIGVALDVALFAYLLYGLSNLAIPLDINL